MLGLIAPVVVEVVREECLLHTCAIDEAAENRVQVVVLLHSNAPGHGEGVHVLLRVLVLESDDNSLIELVLEVVLGEIERHVAHPACRGALEADQIAKVPRLECNRTRSGEAVNGNSRQLAGGGRQVEALPPRLGTVLQLQHLVEALDVVSEAVDEAGHRLLEVALLHESAGEENARHVRRLPLARLQRETAAGGEGRHHFLREDVGVEAEASAEQNPVVVEGNAHLPALEPDVSGETAVLVLAHSAQLAVEDVVLRLELVGVEEVVVHSAQVADEVRGPGELEEVRADDLDLPRRLDQVVCRLESAVALADDEDALVLEVVWVDRHCCIGLAVLDAVHVGEVLLVHASRHNKAVTGPRCSVGRLQGEPWAVLQAKGASSSPRHSLDFGAELNGQRVRLDNVCEVVRNE
mmetsp:Transcript_15413/g.60234  ORF Transcript_15413/g.60234 Transcript_15413/m.60234 type:complete len:409 (-) Transcript_15413:302-1528(-)